jgi:hypothetical protein
VLAGAIIVTVNCGQQPRNLNGVLPALISGRQRQGRMRGTIGDSKLRAGIEKSMWGKVQAGV